VTTNPTAQEATLTSRSRCVYRHVPSNRSWQAFRDFITEFNTALLGNAAEKDDISDEEWQAQAALFWSAADAQSDTDSKEECEQQHGE